MKRLLLWLVVVALVGSVGVVAWLNHGLDDHPSLQPYERYWIAADSAAAEAGQVRITFLGVSTVLISDGRTAIMTDGFFTRPSRWRTLLGSVAPDVEIISRSLERAGVERLAAVMVVHSHYDHAMDAPEVARQTGAIILGSPSTANVARGWGLREEKIRIVEPRAPLSFGDFRVTMIPSQHFPHGMAMGEIDAPLVPPARALAYKEGGSYSVLVEHPSGSLLVQGSAGFVAGALAGYHADVVLLGMAGLGTKDDAYRDAYFREVVEAVGARRIIPVHWDDFTLPLDQPLVPLPRLLDDFDASMRFLVGRGGAERRVELLRPWTPVRPF